LGNLRTFIVNWALARRLGWRIIMRIEDLDGPRIKSDAADELLETLSWLGLDWDVGPLIQSNDPAPYVDAMMTLASRGVVYPCELTRKQIEEAASAPHAGQRESHAPPALRPDVMPSSFTDPTTSWRLATPQGPMTFEDDLHGRITQDPSGSVGDFVVWTKRSQPAYQLAVVVDDHRQGVTRVVRGDDLLDSTARQLHLYHLLNLTPTPRFMHLPLVVGPDGRRLAKRHGDSRIDTYRRAGVPPERLIALMSRWCRLGEPESMTALEFAQALDPHHPHSMGVDRIVFTEEADSWLRSGV